MAWKLVFHLVYPVQDTNEAERRKQLLQRKFGKGPLKNFEEKDGSLIVRVEYDVADWQNGAEKLGKVIANNGPTYIRQVHQQEPYLLSPKEIFYILRIDDAFIRKYVPKRS